MSDELRAAVAAAVAKHGSFSQAARAIKVNRQTLSRILSRDGFRPKSAAYRALGLPAPPQDRIADARVEAAIASLQAQGLSTSIDAIAREGHLARRSVRSYLDRRGAPDAAGIRKARLERIEAIVSRYQAEGLRLNVHRMAREARTSGDSVRAYLRAEGLKSGPSRAPTPAEVEAMKAAIKAEGLAAMQANRNRHAPIKHYCPRVYRVERSVMG